MDDMYTVLLDEIGLYGSKGCSIEDCERALRKSAVKFSKKWFLLSLRRLLSEPCVTVFGDSFNVLKDKSTSVSRIVRVQSNKFLQLVAMGVPRFAIDAFDKNQMELLEVVASTRDEGATVPIIDISVSREYNRLEMKSNIDSLVKSGLLASANASKKPGHGKSRKYWLPRFAPPSVLGATLSHNMNDLVGLLDQAPGGLLTLESACYLLGWGTGQVKDIVEYILASEDGKTTSGSGSYTVHLVGAPIYQEHQHISDGGPTATAIESDGGSAVAEACEESPPLTTPSAGMMEGWGGGSGMTPCFLLLHRNSPPPCCDFNEDWLPLSDPSAQRSVQASSSQEPSLYSLDSAEKERLLESASSHGVTNPQGVPTHILASIMAFISPGAVFMPTAAAGTTHCTAVSIPLNTPPPSLDYGNPTSRNTIFIVPSNDDQGGVRVVTPYTPSSSSLRLALRSSLSTIPNLFLEASSGTFPPKCIFSDRLSVKVLEISQVAPFFSSNLLTPTRCQVSVDFPPQSTLLPYLALSKLCSETVSAVLGGANESRKGGANRKVRKSRVREVVGEGASGTLDDELGKDENDGVRESEGEGEKHLVEDSNGEEEADDDIMEGGEEEDADESDDDAQPRKRNASSMSSSRKSHPNRLSTKSGLGSSSNKRGKKRVLEERVNSTVRARRKSCIPFRRRKDQEEEGEEEEVEEEEGEEETANRKQPSRGRGDPRGCIPSHSYLGLLPAPISQSQTLRCPGYSGPPLPDVAVLLGGEGSLGPGRLHEEDGDSEGSVCCGGVGSSTNGDGSNLVWEFLPPHSPSTSLLLRLLSIVFHANSGILLPQSTDLTSVSQLNLNAPFSTPQHVSLWKRVCGHFTKQQIRHSCDALLDLFHLTSSGPSLPSSINLGRSYIDFFRSFPGYNSSLFNGMLKNLKGIPGGPDISSISTKDPLTTDFSDLWDPTPEIEAAVTAAAAAEAAAPIPPFLNISGDVPFSTALGVIHFSLLQPGTVSWAWSATEQRTNLALETMRELGNDLPSTTAAVGEGEGPPSAAAAGENSSIIKSSSLAEAQDGEPNKETGVSLGKCLAKLHLERMHALEVYEKRMGVGPSIPLAPHTAPPRSIWGHKRRDDVVPDPDMVLKLTPTEDSWRSMGLPSSGFQPPRVPPHLSDLMLSKHLEAHSLLLWGSNQHTTTGPPPSASALIEELSRGGLVFNEKNKTVSVATTPSSFLRLCALRAAAASPPSPLHAGPPPLIRRQCSIRGEVWVRTASLGEGGVEEKSTNTSATEDLFFWVSQKDFSEHKSGSSSSSTKNSDPKINWRVLQAAARSVTLLLMHAGAASESYLVTITRRLFPPTHLRMLLRWLSSFGILRRSFSLVGDYPPPPTLSSPPLISFSPPLHSSFLCELASLLFPPHHHPETLLTLDDAVALWEGAPFLQISSDGKKISAASSSLASPPTTIPPIPHLTRRSLVHSLHNYASSSPCPIPGLITHYSAPPEALMRLAYFFQILSMEDEDASLEAENDEEGGEDEEE